MEILPSLNSKNTLAVSQSVPSLPKPASETPTTKCPNQDKVTMTDTVVQPKQTQTESKPPIQRQPPSGEIQTFLKAHHLEKNVYHEPNNQSIDQLRYQLRMKNAAEMQKKIYHTFLEHQRYTTPEKVRFAQTLENPPLRNSINYSPQPKPMPLGKMVN